MERNFRLSLGSSARTVPSIFLGPKSWETKYSSSCFVSGVTQVTKGLCLGSIVWLYTFLHCSYGMKTEN